MNIIKMSLSTNYDLRPSHIQISCCGEVIHDGELVGDLDLEHEIRTFEKFEIEIVKTGKVLDIVDRGGIQEVIIESIDLNGIGLKIKEFGEFRQYDNPYLQDQITQTNRLHVNGRWNFQLSKQKLLGEVNEGSIDEMRDPFVDCDIACFGCSQTYGSFLDCKESWPYQLQSLTGKRVANYGIPGSNLNEMIALVDAYRSKHIASIILLYLPHTFRRQVHKNGKIMNINVNDKENRDLVMHGEEHSVALVSGEFRSWLETVSTDTKIYFGTYQSSEDELFRKTDLKKFMFPFLEGIDYPKASDGSHHGAEFNRDFAKMLKDFLSIV
jgi:hypothetical protein